MTITGLLKKKMDTQIVSEKFKKREFILTTDHTSPYPQHLSILLTQDKCGLIDHFSEGQEITVSYNLKGREWNGNNGVQYFNTIEAWSIKTNN